MASQPVPRTKDFGQDLKQALRTAGGRGATETTTQNERAQEPPFVFLAYDRRDHAAARVMVDALRARGIRVRWDRDFLAGSNFRRLIPSLIATASATLVIWSEHSVASDFVIDEAERAKAVGRLVPCVLGAQDDIVLPVGFGSIHCVPADAHDDIVLALEAMGIEPAAGD